MKLEQIQLKDFRSYTSLELNFGSRLVFLTGNNAAGKTNLLEAISMLIYGKSFRGATDRDLIRQGSSGTYFISGTYSRNELQFKLELGCEIESRKLKKKIKKNGKPLSGRAELIGNLVGVVFSPSDILIADGGAQERRRFLDSLLSRQDPEYLSNLVKYNRALKQRNTVLKKIREKKAGQNELEVWNDGIIRFGEKVIGKRIQFIAEFGSIFQESLLHISRKHDPIEIELVPAHPNELKDFKQALLANLYRDLSCGYTTTGPHRHSLLFGYRGKDITVTGSQGQKRSVVLALRIAEFHYLKKSLGISPLLLIDDVIRELDANRRSAFIEILHRSGQAIFTTPDLDGLHEFIRSIGTEATIYRVIGDGRVVEESL